MSRQLVQRVAQLWPWVALSLVFVPASLQFVTFETELDGDYPAVARNTYNARPPAAYRLAEPGDTLDKVAMYIACAGVVLSAVGWMASRGAPQLWPAALAWCAIWAWDAATPWPTFDGWWGYNWRALFTAGTPVAVRLLIAAAALSALSVILLRLNAVRPRWNDALERHCGGLLIVSAVLLAWRLLGVPDPEPHGYWPRWAMIAGILAFDLMLVRCMPPWPAPRRRLAVVAGCVVVWFGLITGGRWMITFHRPLVRLHAVVPGRIYISEMPTYQGLKRQYERVPFKTIINVFNENTSQRSPLLPQELRFVKEHGIRYITSPGNLESDAFLDETLRLAQDPDAWPILVHCHGCMDRSPAWMGIYRFVVQKRPLLDILREIEAHRGLRPKSTVTLLYNRVLSARDPERYAADPVAQDLVRNARGTQNPYERMVRENGKNPPDSDRR